MANHEVERQKILSMIRQETNSDEIKQLMTRVQEEAVNQTRATVSKILGDNNATNFQNNITAAWRDPLGEIDTGNETATRVYAEGTTGEGVDGVLIDGGEAKITQTKGGNLKIEYAPGTGPGSTTIENGEKRWRIQQSNGTVIESYTAGGQVVIGQSTGVSSNVIVNTVTGETSATSSTTTQNVVSGSTSGNTNIVVEGGNPGVKESSDNSNNSGNEQQVVQ